MAQPGKGRQRLPTDVAKDFYEAHGQEIIAMFKGGKLKSADFITLANHEDDAAAYLAKELVSTQEGRTAIGTINFNKINDDYHKDIISAAFDSKSTSKAFSSKS